MGATSVTGVGPGSAEGQQKGREEYSIGVERLIGPRVMAAGSVDMDGSAAVDVVLPLLPGDVADYVVSLTNATSAAVVWGSLTFNTNDTTITINDATTTDTVHWVIVKVGLSV